MAAPIVFDGVAEGAGITGELFAGLKFFVARRLPARNSIVDNIRSNGGQVVQTEKQADHLIADHFRHDCPPGSISYTFIERSMKDGVLANPEDHAAGPPLGTARDRGSVARPAKPTRNAYTAEDDRILYEWVTDKGSHSGREGTVSGNELYKQLGKIHTQHPWQSWRDRYLKHLIDKPPPRSQIPDNANPSPPLDQAAEALRALFDDDDFEELYANADQLIRNQGDAHDYEKSWVEWAEFKNSQTADQWKQYFEQVVRPQWEKDDPAKREAVEMKVHRKHEEKVDDESAEQDPEPAGPSSPNPSTPQRKPSKARVTNVERGPVEDGTSKERSSDTGGTDEEQVGGNADADDGHLLATSSTAAQETPDYIRREHDSLMKRIHDDDFDDVDPFSEEAALSRETKRLKHDSTSTAPVEAAAQTKLTGTHDQPFEISSAASSSSLSSDDSQPQRPDMDHLIQAQLEDEEEANMSADDSTPIVEESKEDYMDFDEQSDPDLPPDTPTPRAARHSAAIFDTQAILTPSQGFRLEALPRPGQARQRSQSRDRSESEDSSLSSQDLFLEALPRPQQQTPAHGTLGDSSLPPDVSSPLKAPESIASTTQSLQEFHETVHEASLPHSTASEGEPDEDDDPDPPLHPDEVPDFMKEQREEGFKDAEVRAALKITCCRPVLAIKVLDAWGGRKLVPDGRGIWSKEDDDLLYSGDQSVLKRLERKHTVDGWGGVTERMEFLNAYRAKVG